MLLACVTLVAGLASADTFIFCSTGFNAGCTSEVGLGGRDGNWSLIAAPPPVPLPFTLPYAPYITNNRPGEWVADSATSEWISPHQNETGSESKNLTVPFIYQQTFSLSGFIPTSVVISGQWSVDNFGYIVVNGTQVTLGTSGNIPNLGGEFDHFTSFVLDSSNATFNPDANTIQFFVFNNLSVDPNPSGVNVHIISATADPSEVPEPGTWMSLSGGLLALAAFGRRLRK